MLLNPVNDVILIEKDGVTETESGIQLLESHKDPAGTDTGRIVNVNGYYKDSEGRVQQTNVTEGDRVLFMRKHGIAVKGSKTLVAVRQGQLLAVFDYE